MPTPVTVDSANLVRVIQAATAPVVLISAVGLLLLVLTNRLARIVDRARLVLGEVRSGRRELAGQLLLLARRGRLIRLAIALSAGTVVLVGVLVTLLFVGAILRVEVVRIAIALFIAAMLSLVAAMLVFMRELMLALRGLESEMAEAGGSG